VWGGSEQTFAADGTLRSLEAIEFPRLDVTERSGDQATVAFSTRARHADYTDACEGTVTVTRGPDGTWLMGRPSTLSCDKV
jgi:hypothetical protein